MSHARAILVAVVLAACGAPAQSVEIEEPHAQEPPPRYAIALRLDDAEEREDGTPQTRVSLVRIRPDGERTVEALRTEPGACYHVDPGAGALIQVRCWWAGQGAMYAVRRSHDAVVALRADVDEEAGAGELEEVARVDVPDDAELDVLAPEERASR